MKLDPAPGWDALVQNFTIEAVQELNLCRHSSVGPICGTVHLDELLPARKSDTTRLDLANRALQRCGHCGDGELDAGHARCFQHRLLIRSEPLQIELDHLDDARRRVDALRPERFE